jgi:hypothetical protein
MSNFLGVEVIDFLFSSIKIDFCLFKIDLDYDGKGISIIIGSY